MFLVPYTSNQNKSTLHIFRYASNYIIKKLNLSWLTRKKTSKLTLILLFDFLLEVFIWVYSILLSLNACKT